MKRRLLLLVFCSLSAGCSGSSSIVSDCTECPQLVILPAGDFTMGSPGSEPFRGLEPEHAVKVPAFAIGKYEVTFAQWDACVADRGCTGPAAQDEGWGRGTRPAIGVTWDEAKEYTEWLSRKTGKQYRLPTEAEWEYAARARTTTPFSFGTIITTDQANYNGSTAYADGPVGANRQQTQPVGSFPANAFGLHDMHGNAAEWVEDCWRDGYGDPPAADAKPYVDAECAEHVVRGGSWDAPPDAVRAAARIPMRRDQQSPSLGFRVARAP